MISARSLDDVDWIGLVSHSPRSTPFHDRSWIEVISDCYGFCCHAVTLSDGRETLAGIPVLEVGRGARKRWVSLPFTDRCEPLLAREDAAYRLAEELDDFRRSRDLRTIELRAELCHPPGYSVACGYWHEMALPHEPDEIYRGFNRLRRRLLRRAETTGVVVRRATCEADLCDVFFTLHVATRRRLGVPAQPRRLFELLWRKVIGPGSGFLLLAYLDSAPIAAAAFLTGHGRITAKFSATDRVYATSGGMDSVYWHAMQWGCENGYDMFDFGRTEYGNDGLRSFKLSWGVREEPLAYTLFAKEPPTQHAPRLRSAVGLVIRKSPSWMTRAVGHAAYRFTA